MKRRDFLHDSFLIGAGFSFLPNILHCQKEQISLKMTSRVVLVENRSVRNGISFEKQGLDKMLDAGISELYKTDRPDRVWKNLFSSNDVVGLKVNCLSGKHGSSHLELVEIIIEKLREAGVKSGNIIIWDRSNEDLESAGYSINAKNKNRVRCFGNDITGFDNRLYINGSVGSLITRTVTDYCSAIINIPALKDHGIVGVTLSMKNFFGAIHNPNKYHDNTGNPYVADLYQLDIIRRKVRLVICDALDAQYEGGPPFKPQWTWQMNSILLAVDGVALDRVGWDLIENKRREMGFKSLKDAGRPPNYIFSAGKKGIGQANLKKIDRVELNL